MYNPIVIDINNEDSCYILIGDIDFILGNRRLLFSLKRLEFLIEKGKIRIPFQKTAKIGILQEIQRLLEKHSLEFIISDKTQVEVSSFDREVKSFKEFSENARNIRNDKFNENPKLVEYFSAFQKIVKAQLIRRLYPLQLLSSFHMAFSQNACNFSVPGSGKTSIVYGAYTYLNSLPQDNPKHVDKLMVIGPLSSFAPWETEYSDCFGRKISSQRLSGDANIQKEKKEQHLYSGNPAELTLICHGGMNTLQEDIVSFLKRNKTMVVIDEAHRIKNPDGVWGKNAIEIAKEAKSRIVLTGTPVPNGYEDLFNLFQFLYPYKYRDILQFHYPNLIDMTKNSPPESSRVKQFIDNISPYFTRIKKTDLHLPPTKDYVITVKMDSNQREIYDFIESRYVKSFMKYGFASLKDVLNKAKLIRLRQAASNPSLLLHAIKETINEDDESFGYAGVDMPEEFQSDSHVFSKIKEYSKTEVPKKFIEIKKLLEKCLASDEKTIVWTIFIQNAKQLREYLDANGISSKLLIGEVEQEERETIVAKFNDPKNNEFMVIIANPFAVSESISLHKGCHTAIYMERDYNCASFIQSKDRIHRYGLSPNQLTNYYYVISENSIDGVINDKLNEKIIRMGKIINDDIPLFTRINDSDESDLITALIKQYAKRSPSI